MLSTPTVPIAVSNLVLLLADMDALDKETHTIIQMMKE